MRFNKHKPGYYLSSDGRYHVYRHPDRWRRLWFVLDAFYPETHWTERFTSARIAKQEIMKDIREAT